MYFFCFGVFLSVFYFENLEQKVQKSIVVAEFLSSRLIFIVIFSPPLNALPAQAQDERKQM